jgi:hypothetical protein
VIDPRHIDDEQAMNVAVLPLDDPERAAAYVHTRSCARCRRALERAIELLRHLEAIPEEEPPSEAALRAIARPVVADLSARTVPVRLVAWILAGAWAMLVLAAKHRAGGALAWTQSAALLTVAVCGALFLRWLRGSAVVVFLVASAVLVALAWGEMGSVTAPGFACLITELGGAALPFAILARRYLHRRTLDLGTPLVTVAAAGALAAQASLHLTCPGRNAGLHLLVFHLGGIAMTVLAACAGGRLLRRHAET